MFNEQFKEHFPTKSVYTQLIILAVSDTNKTVLVESFQNFSYAINGTVRESGMIQDINGYFIAMKDGLLRVG